MKELSSPTTPPTHYGSLHWDQQALLTASTLELALAALAPRGIASVVLKGPHVAVTLYPTPSQRSWTDLDLLVCPTDFLEAGAALAAAGFKAAPLTPSRKATDTTAYCREMISPLGVQVELHRALAPHGLYPIDAEAIIHRRSPFSFLHVNAHGPCPEDLVACLCIHILKTCFWVQEKHFFDLALALQKPGLDWNACVESLMVAGALAGTWQVLGVLEDAYRTPIPARWRESIRPSRWRSAWMGRYLDPSRLLPYRFPSHSPAQMALRLRFPLLDRLRDWPRYLLRYVFTRLADLVLCALPGYNAIYV